MYKFAHRKQRWRIKKGSEKANQPFCSTHVFLFHLANLISLTVTHRETEDMRIAFGCAKVGNDLTFQSSASFSNTITFHSVSLRLAHLNSCKNFPWSPDNIPRLNIQKGYFKEGCLYSDCRGRLCHLTSPRGFPLVTFCLFISALLRGPLFSCNQPLRTNQEAKKSRNARPLPISFTPLSANRRADRGRASCQF